MTELAALMIPAIFARSEGMIMELLAWASLPNSFRYCSAMRRFTALTPPFSFIEEAISLIPLAVASATFKISTARPSASFIRFCF